MTEPVLNHGDDCPVCTDLLQREEDNPRFGPVAMCVTCLAVFTLDGRMIFKPIPVEDRNTSAGITMVPPESK